MYNCFRKNDWTFGKSIYWVAQSHPIDKVIMEDLCKNQSNLAILLLFS